MLESKLIEFLETHIIKKGEKLDLTNLSGGQFIDIPIVKSTKQTFRRLGILTIGVSAERPHIQEIDDALKELHFTPRAKRKLDADAIQTITWLQDGWIIKEIRLKQDSRTLDTQHYRMGYRLFKYNQHLEQQQVEKNKQAHAQLKNDMQQVTVSENQLMIKQQIFHNLKETFICACEQYNHSETTLFAKTWTARKRLKFLHFILAVVQIGANKEQFDWKEIGATYYKKIGGSKVFDLEQKDFLRQFETWSGYSPSEFGLSSLGQITPLFFSGQLSGNYSNYQYGPVHALTNIALNHENEHYTTGATTLWIVENRGILTRIASQVDFLQTTATLMLCCDGYIRSSHRHFIEQIAQLENIKQIIIWTDYDTEGMEIAHELYQIVKKDKLTIKFISPFGEIHRNWQAYAEEMNGFLENQAMEQEEMIGDVERWKNWISN